MQSILIIARVVIMMLVCCLGIPAEPIIMNGAMLPEFLGKPVSGIRIINAKGAAIPFQIDEKTCDGEYVCPQGESPNADSADNTLDRQDEIVFLREDADTFAGIRDTTVSKAFPVTITQGPEMRSVWIVENEAIPLSTVSYCSYDHDQQYLRTPFYYAQFARDRFHFTKAGVMDFENRGYIDLAKELRVEIMFKLLWGLIPVKYTEESIVCHVKRYKAGPVRLIRRGNFYLKLGLGIKGSRAVVYQMCYPQLVKVPVNVHVPVRLKNIFSDAYIEMTPVIRKDIAEKDFHFKIPDIGYCSDLASGRACMDTLIRAVLPDKGYLISDGLQGYGWITHMGVDSSLLSGSGYIMRRPSKRGGMAECGFRLKVRDLPRGNYDVVNWVLFSKHSLETDCRNPLSMLVPASITNVYGTYLNLLVSSK